MENLSKEKSKRLIDTFLTGIPVATIAERYSVSRSSVYKLVAKAFPDRDSECTLPIRFMRKRAQLAFSSDDMERFRQLQKHGIRPRIIAYHMNVSRSTVARLDEFKKEKDGLYRRHD